MPSGGPAALIAVPVDSGEPGLKSLGVDTRTDAPAEQSAYCVIPLTEGTPYWYGNYPPHRAPLCVRLFGTWPRACAGPDLQAGVREPCTWLNRADPRSVVSRISGPRPRGARHPRGLRHCCVIPERKWGGLRSAHKGCASREGPVIPPRPVSPGSRDEISWCWLQASNL